jgi:glycosyltransferase involved in cell wall biosynthesis
MSEPLGQSQVLPYLRGLARLGWRFDLMAFEPPSADEGELRMLKEELTAEGINYTWAKRSSSHALPVKAWEATNALVRLAAGSVIHRPRIVHARSYLPAAVGRLLANMIPRAKLVFDCRGLLADEYVDAGHWTKQSGRYRLVKRAERWLFARADAVVTLTERLRRWLTDSVHLLPATTLTEVIPCCVDLDRFRLQAGAREDSRASLDAGERFVVVYSGSLGSWYREPDMARLFAAIRRRRPAMLAIFSRSPTETLRRHLREQGVADQDVVERSVRPAEMPHALAAGDAAFSLIDTCFSKMASSPTKIAEYLALGLPVALNVDIGDGQELAGASDAIIDVGSLTDEDCERAAQQLIDATARPGIAGRARTLAEERFSVATVGVTRYARLYDRLLEGAATPTRA